MPKFIPGLVLGKQFYLEEIKPIVAKEFPNLEYSAALIGWGSEVLGYDTPISRDHHWGPRGLLYLHEKDHAHLKDQISRTLSLNLPVKFRGYSTNFSKPEPNGVRHPLKINSGPVHHMVEIYTIRSFFEERLKFDAYGKISITDWLTFPQQRLLELTAGAVYHDGLNELNRIREKFSFYPHDLWLYLLAAQWRKISQEEAFVGRTRDVGDELGSQVVASRLVRELMSLSFLMERQYAPYSKWFGTAFVKLKIAKKLLPILQEVLLARNWKQRERRLGSAYSLVAKYHNQLGITDPMPIKTSRYYGRPYYVIHADQFSAEIRKNIKHTTIKRIQANIGSIDQFTDSSEVVNEVDICRKLGIVYAS